MRSLASAWLALTLLCAAGACAQVPPLHYAELGACKLESGAAIQNCRLGYRTFGTLNKQHGNVILYPMWFAGRSGDVGAIIGPGPTYVLDTRNYFVVVVDPFGNGVSSSPSNSAAQHGTAFPVFTIRDMVHAEQRLLRETLHLDHLHAVVGQSMGGMQAFEWAVDAPAFMDEVVSIIGTPQLTSYDLLLWSTEKEALEQDPAYAHGTYTRRPTLPVVALIHQMHLATPEFRVDHITREGFAPYLAQVESMTTSDANDYLRQLQAMLSHDIAHGGDIYATARTVQARMLIINAEQDQMVNPIPALAFARLIHAQTLVLHSDCGHMAPGCEQPKVASAVDQFLASAH